MPESRRSRKRQDPDPGIVVPQADEKGKPRGNVVLREHPLFDEIDEYLRARYSPTTILKMLESTYGDQLAAGMLPALPSARTLERHRADLPPSDLLPARLIEQKLEKLNQSVDLFKSLQLLYISAEERVARLLDGEEQMQLALPVAGVDKAYETALAVAHQLWSVGQDIGAYPRQGKAIVAAFGPGGMMIGVEEVTDEEIELVAASMFHQRTGRLPPALGQKAPRIVNGVAELVIQGDAREAEVVAN